MVSVGIAASYDVELYVEVLHGDKMLPLLFCVARPDSGSFVGVDNSSVEIAEIGTEYVERSRLDTLLVI